MSDICDEQLSIISVSHRRKHANLRLCDEVFRRDTISTSE